jgi:hypothetical protein
MVWVVYDYTCDEVNGGRRKFFPIIYIEKITILLIAKNQKK